MTARKNALVVSALSRWVHTCVAPLVTGCAPAHSGSDGEGGAGGGPTSMSRSASGSLASGSRMGSGSGGSGASPGFKVAAEQLAQLPQHEQLDTLQVWVHPGCYS